MSEITPLNVDFSQIKTPDYVGGYANAFAAGRALAHPASITQPPAPEENAMTATPAPASPAALPTALPTLGARIATMAPAQRQAAAAQADKLAAVGLGLRSVAYAERPAVLAHLAPALARAGIDPAAIAGYDPSDDNLDAQVAAMLSFKRTLEGAGANAFGQNPSGPNAFSPAGPARGG